MDEQGALWKSIVLLAVAGLSAATDLRWRRVPNSLTLSVTILGFVAGALTDGWWGIVDALRGFVLGLSLLLVPWLLGWVGGGDVKFLAAIGALAGAPFVLRAAVLGSLLGGAMALTVLVWRTPWRRLFAEVTGFLLARAGGVPARLDLGEVGRTTLPYAVALAGGVVGTLVLRQVGWGW